MGKKYTPSGYQIIDLSSVVLENGTTYDYDEFGNDGLILKEIRTSLNKPLLLKWKDRDEYVHISTPDILLDLPMIILITYSEIQVIISLNEEDISVEYESLSIE